MFDSSTDMEPRRKPQGIEFRRGITMDSENGSTTYCFYLSESTRKTLESL